MTMASVPPYAKQYENLDFESRSDWSKGCRINVVSILISPWGIADQTQRSDKNH